MVPHQPGALVTAGSYIAQQRALAEAETELAEVQRMHLQACPASFGEALAQEVSSTLQVVSKVS